MPSTTTLTKVANALELLQEQSYDPSTTVAALIYKEEEAPNCKMVVKILGAGANNFPAGVDRDILGRYEDRAVKYPFMLHAEMDALTQAAKEGRATDGAMAGVTLFTCYDCATMLAEAGIKEITFDAFETINLTLSSEPGLLKRWAFRRPMDYLNAARIPYDVHVKTVGTATQESFTRTMEFFCDRIYKEEPEAPTFEPNPWLLVKNAALANDDSKIRVYQKQPTKGILEKIKRAKQQITKALKSRKGADTYLPEHGAALLGAGPNMTFTARPPVRSGFKVCSRKNGAAYAMPPAMLLVAAAARRGVALRDTSVYLTHYPTDRSAVLLAGAGIKTLYIQHQPLPDNLPIETANSLAVSHRIFEESGIKQIFLDVPHGKRPLAEIKGKADPAFLKKLRIKPVKSEKLFLG